MPDLRSEIRLVRTRTGGTGRLAEYRADRLRVRKAATTSYASERKGRGSPEARCRTAVRTSRTPSGGPPERTARSSISGRTASRGSISGRTAVRTAARILIHERTSGIGLRTVYLRTSIVGVQDSVPIVIGIFARDDDDLGDRAIAFRIGYYESRAVRSGVRVAMNGIGGIHDGTVSEVPAVRVRPLAFGNYGGKVHRLTGRHYQRCGGNRDGKRGLGRRARIGSVRIRRRSSERNFTEGNGGSSIRGSNGKFGDPAPLRQREPRKRLAGSGNGFSSTGSRKETPSIGSVRD